MNEQPIESTESVSRLEVIGQLRAQITDVMPDAETMWQTNVPPPPRRSFLQGRGVTRQPAVQPSSPTFRGHLAVDASQAYGLLRERFAALGYTPLLRQQGGYDYIIVLQHVFPQAGAKMSPKQWVPNVVLLVLTLFTTTTIGAIMEQGERLMENPMLFFQQPWLILTGIPASLTIMGILGIHELGHYFVARRHGLSTTLPYFIPVPFGFGTFGAIIRIQTPWEDRRALFDIGLAGPLSGLVVALPLFFIGLLTSPAQPPIPEGMPLGSPLLLQAMEKVVYWIRGIPPDYEIYVNAMTFSAWFGLVVTGVNLLPVGQLDGGHVAYALLGHWARALGIVVMVALVILGTMAWSGWYVWAAFIFFSGWQHPAPLNALTPLGRTRQIIGVLAAVLLILLFTPAPFPI
jgi:membrane-associated protease RseP (regulator of RpoE activity)